MRYRVYFKKNDPVELTAYDLRVTSPKSLELETIGEEATVDVAFCRPMIRIADNHDRTIYQQ